MSDSAKGLRTFLGEMTDAFISTFESLPHEVYRRTISTSVRALLAKAAIHPSQGEDPPHADKTDLSSGPRWLAFSIYRYDSDVLTDALLNEIPWKELCTDHDQRMLRQRQQEQFRCKKRRHVTPSAEGGVETTIELADSSGIVVTTPLRITLEVFENDAATFPWACAKALTRVLLVHIVFMDKHVCGHSGTNHPVNPHSCGSSDTLRPSRESVLCTLVRCFERIPALSLQELLLELLQKHILSRAAEPSLFSTFFPRISSPQQLHRIWNVFTASVELSSSIGSASRQFKLAPGRDTCHCLQELRIHLHFLLVMDDLSAQRKQQRLPARMVGTDVDSEEQQDQQQMDRARTKRRARLPLTGQQQVLLCHGEIYPSDEFDSDDKDEEEGGIKSVHAIGPESVIASKVRRYHRHRHNGSNNVREIRNGSLLLEGHDWHRKETTSMRTTVLSQYLARSKSMSFGQGMQVLNLLLLPAFEANPWSTSIRLLMVMQVAAIDRVANPIRPSSTSSSSFSSSALHQQMPKMRASRLYALQHLLNEVWDRVLYYLACNDERNNGQSSSTALGSKDDIPSSWIGIAMLHFYAELLGECAWFDDDTLLACALKPLLQAIVADVELEDLSEDPYCAATHDAWPDLSLELDTVNQRSGGLPEHARSGKGCATPFRCALAFIMSRRGRPAVVDSFSQQSSRIRGGTHAWTYLTLRFCHWSDWYHEAWHEDRVRIRLALRAAGILSVCDEAVVASRLKPGKPSRHRGGMRSYVSSCCNQSKSLREFVHGGNQPLFSQGCKDSVVDMNTKSSSSRRRQDPTLLPGQHMSGDVVRHVFGFLGYKRLVRMRAVCQEWKLLADDSANWRRLYCSRFGTPQGIVVTSPSRSEELDWKSLFERKLAAERPLRFRRHSSGWKVRTCRFVGCLHLLTTPGLASRHEKAHLKSRPIGSKRQRKVVSRSSVRKHQAQAKEG